MKWFQLLLLNSNYSIPLSSFIFILQLNGQNSIWFIDRTLTGATTSGQNGQGSNGNQRILCIHQSSKTRISLDLVSYLGQSLGCEILTKCRDAVGIFYSWKNELKKTMERSWKESIFADLWKAWKQYVLRIENVQLSKWKVKVKAQGLMSMTEISEKTHQPLKRWIASYHILINGKLFSWIEHPGSR